MRRGLALIALLSATAFACGINNQRERVPQEVEETVANIGSNLDQERYDQIYNESSDLWKQSVTLEQSKDVFKTLRTKLGKIESRSLNSAAEQQNSGGALKGHAFILSYETRFERGAGMETFTLIEENGRWLLARYLVNSTDLK
jgi:catalase